MFGWFTKWNQKRKEEKAWQEKRRIERRKYIEEGEARLKFIDEELERIRKGQTPLYFDLKDMIVTEWQ